MRYYRDTWSHPNLTRWSFGIPPADVPKKALPVVNVTNNVYINPGQSATIDNSKKVCVSTKTTTNNSKPMEESFKTPPKPKNIPKRKSLIERWGTIPTEEERKATAVSNVGQKSVSPFKDTKLPDLCTNPSTLITPACKESKLPSSCRKAIELSSADSSVDDSIVRYRALKREIIRNLLQFLIFTVRKLLLRIL